MGRWRSNGQTATDPVPHAPGFMTKGIEDPKSYYYRRVFADAVRAIEAVRSLPEVDATKVAVQGISQGGGITLAAAGLVQRHCRCDAGRAVPLPLPTSGRYLRSRSLHGNHEIPCRPSRRRRYHFNTLSYFDAVNFAKRASAPALFSVALMDKICPPPTVYAAYHAYGGAKEIVVYPFNDHEGGLRPSTARPNQVAQSPDRLRKRPPRKG